MRRGIKARPVLNPGARSLPGRIRAVEVATLSTSQSFFAKLSRSTRSTVELFVYPYERLYLTVGYLPKAVSREELYNVLGDERGKVLEMTVERSPVPQGTYVVALKERCEFYRLLETYGVVISVPYRISDGRRSFCIFGEERELERYLENLESFYGSKNVVYRATRVNECVRRQVSALVRNFVLSQLTEREMQVLLKAYQSGYISSRRRVDLGELAGMLHIAKPTASLTVRKAIEKLIRGLLETY